MKKRILKGLVFSIAMTLAFGLCGCERIFLHKGFPQLEGTISVSPLQKNVEILRDAYGIPHIFAENQHDLMVALGTVHAQDRLWQMETFRRMAEGRLAEVAGEETLELDHWARLMDFTAMRTALVKNLDSGQKELLSAYLDGINSYIERKAGDLPLEFQSLNITPEPWDMEDVFSVSVVNAWFLATNFPQEWLALSSRKHLDLEKLKDVLPSSPNAKLPEDAYYQELRKANIGGLLPAMESLYMVASGHDGQGSNNWVMAKGPGGKPLLSSDPHLGLMVPGVWYYCHLSLPGGDVAGASMPGIPAIIIGTNRHIAWGWTNVMADIADLYVFRLDPGDSSKYIVGDTALAFDKEKQVYTLPDGKTEVREILRTIHGPVITEISEGCDAVAALKWLGSVPFDSLGDQSSQGLFALNHGKNVTEAFDAVSLFKLQAQNLVVADVEGNIGFHAFGGIPLRKGYSGRLPADGSSGEMDWTGFLSYEDMPSEVNPERGWIATANNKTTGDDAPHPLTYGWCSPYRHQRISQHLADLKNPTPEDYQKIQKDVHSLQAEKIVLKLKKYSFSDSGANAAMALLSGWDYNVTDTSAEAAVWELFVLRWADNLLGDELGKNMRWYHRLLAAAYLAHDVVLDRPQSALWDNVTTPEKETPQQILEKSLRESLVELENRLGPDPKDWEWGKIHRYFFAHPGARKSIEHKMLSRGPFPAPGDNTTINMAAFEGGGKHMDAFIIPSLRMIAPLNDLDATTIAGPMGQSAQPGHPHYDDLIEPWMNGKGVPLPLSREVVTEQAVHKLVLTP